MPSYRYFCWILIATCSLFSSFVNPISAQEDHWAASVKLPEGEQPVALFNGKNLEGWEGNLEYFSVNQGAIRAHNAPGVVLPESTYLFTKDSFRNFRLLLEVKQSVGKDFHIMHSAVAAVGEKKSSPRNKYGFHGPLLMFCQDWGIYDAGGRGRIAPPGQKDPIHVAPYEKLGEWNQLEMLVYGNRIRIVSNGQLVCDYTEDPSRLKICPLGLQLHNNQEQQEFRFRGLIVVRSPADELVTLKK